MISEYNLSVNDMQEISFFTKGCELSNIARKALFIISHVEGGLHHVDWKQKEKFNYTNNLFFEYVRYGSLATYDSNELTTLVLLAHEMAVRVEIQSRGFGYMRILFHERMHDDKESLYKRHPTIESAVKNMRANI